ncbi:MAG: methyltransferase domain-containing protein [Pseudomonadota bacterium]|nr:methyltransferase domain-containing protein [Pseudomonadota bacterium]
MKLLDDANAKQSAYWNGDAGRRWTAIQESQDRLFTEITAALFAAAAPQPGEKVLDVGCGAGETTLRAASLTGAALGVDVSEPLLARARERADETGSPARFAHADATAYDFSDHAADLLISRFGVMFFAEPAKSFANLRRGMKPGGRLAFVCWRRPELNPWLMTPLAAALNHLPPQPEAAPDDPGPFAFCDEARVRGILEAAGFTEVSFTPHAFKLDVADGEGLDSAVAKCLTLGPTSRALDGQPEATVQAVRQAVRATLAPYLKGGVVALDGAVWIVRARA